MTVRGLDRDAKARNLALPVVLPMALARGVGIVRGFRPDVVLGVGGYAMAPALAGARLLGVPYVLHEQNVRPGLATRLFARGARVVCATFAQTVDRLPRARVVVTGLPLRPGFRRRNPAAPARVLLVTGGSQGALRLNRAVWSALDSLLQMFDEVIHLTGEQGRGEIESHRRERYTAMPFADDMPALLARADLVVSRAGVGTLAEIAATGLPAVLVPGTFGGGHQEDNAAAVVEAGAAVRLADGDLSGESLVGTLGTLTPDRLRSMAAASAGLGEVDAARRVVQVLREVAA